MARVLDLNSVQRPTLELTLMDKDRTTLRVTIPKEALIQELQGIDTEALTKGDRDSVDIAFDLAARLISCNRDYVEVTAQELRSTYNMDMEALLIFFGAYWEFIDEVIKAKN